MTVEAAVDIRLTVDLGLEPVDLLLGGERLVDLMSREYLLNHWEAVKAQPEGAKLKPLPDHDIQGFLNQDCAFRIEAHAASEGRRSLATTLEPLSLLRQIASRSRPLALADFHPASNAQRAPKAEDLLDAQVKTVTVLRDRCKQLMKAVDDVKSDLETRTSSLRSALIEIKEAGAKQVQSTLAPLTRDLGAVLRALPRFGLPEALSLYTIPEVFQKDSGYSAHLEQLHAALAHKSERLRAAIEAPVPGIGQLVEALQNACDGEGMPIWPPIDTTASGSQTQPVKSTLGKWPDVREVLRPLQRLVDHLPQYEVRQWQRTDGEASSVHSRVSDISIHLVPQGAALGRTVCGFVVDEWTVFQPSVSHTAGVALNRDAPQCQPPHCLLLGVAASDTQTDWKEDNLAQLVAEAIRLMRLRALSSMDGSVTRLGLRTLNLVPPKSSANGPRRVPVDRQTKYLPWSKELFGWKLKHGRPDGKSAVSLVERTSTGTQL